MKKLKLIYIALAAALLLPFSSCKDEEAYPIPDFETAVHGYGKLTDNSATNFLLGDNAKAIEMTYQWVSIDSKNTVTRIEFYVTFTESYTDLEGNPRTANHGTKLVKVIEGSAVPANRTNITVQIKQDELYNLYKDASFDYGDGNGTVQLYADPDRSVAAPFLSSDNFRVTWALTTADGRYFDSWSDSICGEFETYHGSSPNDGGFNCFYDWTVVCESDIAGIYDAVAVGTSTDPCCPNVTTVNSEVVLTDLGGGSYTISDWSAGLYLEWYAVYGITPQTDLTRTIVEACGKVTIGSFTEPFGEDASATGGLNFANGVITYTWVNGYGDQATVTLTPK